MIPFDNVTFRRGLEMALTRLVDDELRARSPRSAVSPSEADWLVKGTIVRADERIYSEDKDDVVTESSIVIEVDVTLEDRAAEKILRTYTFRDRVPFSAFAGRITTLENAEAEALREIAERIVYWLEAGHPERRP
ncbi:MAG: LptE family protein [Planctomycetota bacterium]